VRYVHTQFNAGEWSEEQELALVKAMKQFGKELGAER
jgi:hypothetical protein